MSLGRSSHRTGRAIFRKIFFSRRLKRCTKSSAAAFLIHSDLNLGKPLRPVRDSAVAENFNGTLHSISPPKKLFLPAIPNALLQTFVAQKTFIPLHTFRFAP